MRKRRIFYTMGVTLIVVFSTTFAILMTLERMDYRNYLKGEYSKSMYQLIDSVKNIKTDLAKSEVIGSKEQGLLTFGNISRNSNIANDKIHSLPVSQESMEKTSKFLSQISDFSYGLIRNSYEGKDLSKKDYKSIESLKNEADYLLIQLNQVQQDINQGRVKWGEIRKKVSLGLNKTEKFLANKKFEEIQNQVIKYPALIYDGPFSDNVLEIKPKVLKEKVITESEAKNSVKKLLGSENVVSMTKKENGKTRIPAYSFDVILKGREKEDTVACNISKNGGKVVYLLDNRKINKVNMDIKKAAKIGEDYLEKVGYKNMKHTYTQKSGNSITISYVYYNDKVAIYPDQIKLKIGLDNGSIIGIESEKYLVSHTEKRSIQKPKVSQKEAREKVNKNLKVSSTNLAIIPSENNKEILCYEFVGKYNDDSFIVYINSQNGNEQKILQIIKTSNGELTI